MDLRFATAEGFGGIIVAILNTAQKVQEIMTDGYCSAGCSTKKVILRGQWPVHTKISCPLYPCFPCCCKRKKRAVFHFCLPPNKREFMLLWSKPKPHKQKILGNLFPRHQLRNYRREHRRWWKWPWLTTISLAQSSFGCLAPIHSLLLNCISQTTMAIRSHDYLASSDYLVFPQIPIKSYMQH